MKIYLDNNLGVEKVEQEELTQDTYGYNILKIYIPNAVLAPYDTFTCYYGALLQNGRKVGWFAMEARTNSDADYEANYTLYKATLEQSVVSVEGKVYIGCQVILGNSGNATLIKKNTAVVQFNVRKSVAINNDILILDPNQTNTDVLESYKQLLENALTTYATKADVNSKLDLKADKSDTYTKAQTDNLLNSKADKTYVDNALSEKADKTDIPSRVKSPFLGVRQTTDGTVLFSETGQFNDYYSVYHVTEPVRVNLRALNPIFGSGLTSSYNTSTRELNVAVDTTTVALKTDIPSLDGYATKTEVDSALSSKADKSNTYTKTEVDSKLDLKANSDNVYSIGQVENLLYGKADKSDTYTKSDVYTKQEVNDKLNGYIKNDDTTYSATVRGQKVIVSNGAGNGSTTYGQSSIQTSNPRKPTCDYYFPDEKSGTLALTSDIPTVNDPTITFTQGGVTKGSISLNQATDQTIELDAGGSGGGSSVVANPTLSGNEATLDGLEVDGTKYKVGGSGGTITLDNIVDKNGNKRFIEGNGIPLNVRGVESYYCKWTLSGTHLMLTYFGSVKGGTFLSYFDLAEFTLPDFIFNKIVTAGGGTTIETKFVTFYFSSETLSYGIDLRKDNDTGTLKITFDNSIQFNNNNSYMFRIQFDLIIDTEQ